MAPGPDPGPDLDTLFAGALRELAADDERPRPCLVALHARPTREVFDRAAGLLDDERPGHRELGAMVLRELGAPDGGNGRPFSAETVPLVLAALREEPDDWCVSSLISALGYHPACSRAHGGLDAVLAHRDHPAQPVRFALACNLTALSDPERTEESVLEVLLRLAGDENEPVRWYALYALFDETAGVSEARRQAWIAGLGGHGAERRAELLGVLELLDH